jgi:hypothetical protein
MNRYGGISSDKAKRVREREKKNARLKKIIAE